MSMMAVESGVNSVKSGPSGEALHRRLRKTSAGVCRPRPGGRQREFLPAAGNCNGTSIGKNAGSWGNYWSSSLNTDNPNNAYNLNFNSDDSDWNNNNRYNGLTVRPVSAFTRA